MIKMHITETGRNNLKEEPQIFNIENKFFNSSDEIKEHLVERYGKLPKMKNKVYVDTKSGELETLLMQYGFLNPKRPERNAENARNADAHMKSNAYPACVSSEEKGETQETQKNADGESKVISFEEVNTKNIKLKQLFA